MRGELPSVNAVWGCLYHCDQNVPTPVFWQSNIWLKPFTFEFDTISQAVATLKSVQRNWASSLFCCFRRGELIRKKLPFINMSPKEFPWILPDSPMGAWTLLDDHTIAASAECSSPFPAGKIEFVQNKIDPPSRAYLKLQEAFTLCRKMPHSGDLCLDAGANPGGWTWVLAQLGAKITSVDRTPLDPRLLAMPNVKFIKHDAFTLKPQDIGVLDWLVCDIICYPPRLYEWIGEWLASGLCRNFICTIKMQGDYFDAKTTSLFAAVPNSKVVHLNYNKHELTWIKLHDQK
ncbi:MAG: SAM-dependent methyltransferase [Termitinemataceae bacterium]|nr:MAG: SAM-dependent methyltransferase [Termitinemataceae bacterium]